MLQLGIVQAEVHCSSTWEAITLFKHMDLGISAFVDFKFADYHHHRRGEYVPLGFRVFVIVIKFADCHHLGNIEH